MNINKLQKVQNSAARIIFNLRKYDHIQPALKSLHWLKINERITYKLATLVFKAKLYKQPSYLSASLVDHRPSRILRSSANTSLLIPSCKTAICSRRFSIAGPTIWNGLPEEVKQAGNVDSFKTKLKTHLFLISYSPT